MSIKKILTITRQFSPITLHDTVFSVYHSPQLKDCESLHYFPVQKIIEKVFDEIRILYNDGILTDDERFTMDNPLELKLEVSSGTAYLYVRHKTAIFYRNVMSWDNHPRDLEIDR
jgi:hypothetical protein